MTPSLDGLEPSLLWKHFVAFSRIPRCSGNEEGAADHVVSVAEENGLAYKRDATGNVVVRKAATPGCEGAMTVVLQGHLDMVCEKDSDVEHDFSSDPLTLEVVGGYVTAQGTTLGGDNAIGLAAALAVLEEEAAVHGPLECLCTVDEERGLNGAKGLQPEFITGRKMINLDSDKDGILVVGCAGGGSSRVSLPLERQSTGEVDTLRIELGGLNGGHSGLDIDKGRGNAIRLLARLLYRLQLQVSAKIVRIDGGNKHNAIPREASATILVPEGKADEAETLLEEHFTFLEAEYAEAEKGMELSVDVTDGDSVDGLGAESQTKVLGLLLGYPVGIVALSQTMPGLVQTSSNLAVVRTTENAMDLLLSTRSSVESSLGGVRDGIEALSVMAGAEVERLPAYPAWTPNLDSPLLQTTQTVYQDLFGKKPEVKAVHAGLETGIIGEKYPGMDMVAMGPTIEDPHSPRERVNIPSVGRFYRLLVNLLEALSRES